MGALASRQNAGVEEADVVSNHAYKYPPRSGSFDLYLFNFYWIQLPLEVYNASIVR